MVEWAALLPAAVLVAATPGANQVLALRNGVRVGARRAVVASLGRFAAFALMVAAVAAGLGALLAASQALFEVLKWAGVLYLAWLGVRSLCAASRITAGDEAVGRPTGDGPARLARQEFVVAMANPKALVLFTVSLPQFVPSATQAPAGPLLAAGLAYVAVELVCATGYAAIGDRLGTRGLGARARRRMERLTGVSMLGLAGWLATEKPA